MATAKIFQQWLARGPFMCSISHRKMCVLILQKSSPRLRVRASRRAIYFLNDDGWFFFGWSVFLSEFSAEANESRGREEGKRGTQ
jgi:hypothetical protein